MSVDTRQYVVRGATCAEKIHYNPVSDTVIWTAAPKGFYNGKSETFKGFEFVDQLVAHLPPRRVQLVRRYGVYAGKVRKQWQERPSIYSLAPESWQKGHPSEPKIVQAIPQEKPETVQVPDSWSKLRKQSWARLLQKVYEVAFCAALPAPLESRPTPSLAPAFGRKSLHVFAISNLPHPFICPKCQGTMSVMAIITTGTWCCRVE